jgi:RNA polymerase primary sigma factor
MARDDDRVLTAAEEVALAKRIERGDLAAKREMIERNLPLVRWLAQRYRGRGVPYEDLVQEGTIGLLRAVERFDHRRAVRFSTYAIWSVRRSLADAVDDERTIRIPSHASHGPAQLQGVAAVTASLDEPIGESGTTLGELIADDHAVDPYRCAQQRENHRRVGTMVALLPDRHREVLVRRYGLDGEEPASHAEIAARLGVGEERSRQLEREALHRLRSLGDAARAAAPSATRAA